MGPEQIIALYADHGTHEQFHAKFKTDLDLTRLASGKFDTHARVCELAALTMNLLPLMGQSGLLGPGRQRPCGQDSEIVAPGCDSCRWRSQTSRARADRRPMTAQ